MANNRWVNAPSTIPETQGLPSGNSGISSGTSTPATMENESRPTPPAPSPVSPLWLNDVTFSGFSPFDGGASLFRKWTGYFLASRSDGETFSVEVSFLQTDTPYVTGPVVQKALEKLMEYRHCSCRPSKKQVCEIHSNEEGQD